MYTLKPFFYDDFYCIGSKCPYTCCGGWLIVVDEESREEYEKYEGLLGYDKEKDVYMLQFNGKNMCPLCDQDQLCKLYKTKGEKAFCKACRTFPRSEFMTKEIEERYLSLGCPYVVSFLKERKDPLSFILEEEETDDNQLVNASEKEVVDAVYETIDMDMNIRNCILDLLQNREWPLWFREFLAAYCLDRVKEEHRLGKSEEVYAILERVLETDFMNMLMQQLKSVQKDEERRFYLLIQIAIELEEIIAEVTFFGEEGGNGTKAAELLNRNRSISFEEYKASEDRWKNGGAEEFDIWMEHIVAYNWMQYAMLGFTEYYMMDHYWNILLEQILIRHFCILHYSIYGDIKWDSIQFIVAFLCRSIGHAEGTMKEKLRNLKEKEILLVPNVYLLM